jgi:hypothetical protein
MIEGVRYLVKSFFSIEKIWKGSEETIRGGILVAERSGYLIRLASKYYYRYGIFLNVYSWSYY